MESTNAARESAQTMYHMKRLKEDANAFAESLRSDRLIKIYVGKESPENCEAPFLIAETALRYTSPYFVAALKESRFQEGICGELKFPEDDAGPWKVFLHWLLHSRALPESEYDLDRTLLIGCWILGHTYDVPEFQNWSMAGLLTDALVKDQACTVTEIKMTFQRTARGSQLRRLMAEGAVWAYRMGDVSGEDLDDIAEMGTGFMSEFCNAEGELEESADRWWSGSKRPWKEYMVGVDDGMVEGIQSYVARRQAKSDNGEWGE